MRDIQLSLLHSPTGYLNMAKAHIVTPRGSKITIEGTPGEVAVLVAKLGELPVHERVKATRSASAAKAKEKQKATPVNLISSLIDGGFFRKPKDLVSVKV